MKNIKDMVKNFSEKTNKSKAKPKPKAEPNEEIPGLVPVNKYARPFEVTGTGILFPDGTLQKTAQGGSAVIDPSLSAQVQKNTADIAKNTDDITQSYTKNETNILLDNKSNKDDSYLKVDTYSSSEIDGKLFTKANKDDAVWTSKNNIATITQESVFKGDINTNPTAADGYFNIKSQAPINAEGQPDYSVAYGINIDLTEGNSAKHTFKITNDEGSIFRIKGGSKPTGFYTGAIENGSNLVNKEYVDKAVKDAGGSEPVIYVAKHSESIPIALSSSTNGRLSMQYQDVTEGDPSWLVTDEWGDQKWTPTIAGWYNMTWSYYWKGPFHTLKGSVYYNKGSATATNERLSQFAADKNATDIKGVHLEWWIGTATILKYFNGVDDNLQIIWNFESKGVDLYDKTIVHESNKFTAFKVG